MSANDQPARRPETGEEQFEDGSLAGGAKLPAQDDPYSRRPMRDSLRRTIVVLVFGVLNPAITFGARIAPEKFIPSFSQSHNPDCPYDQARIESDVAKYDLLAP